MLVSQDDDIHAAHDIVKTHSTDVATMKSGEAGLVLRRVDDQLGCLG